MALRSTMRGYLEVFGDAEASRPALALCQTVEDTRIPATMYWRDEAWLLPAAKGSFKADIRLTSAPTAGWVMRCALPSRACRSQRERSNWLQMTLQPSLSRLDTEPQLDAFAVFITLREG